MISPEWMVLFRLWHGPGAEQVGFCASKLYAASLVLIIEAELPGVVRSVLGRAVALDCGL